MQTMTEQVKKHRVNPESTRREVNASDSLLRYKRLESCAWSTRSISRLLLLLSNNLVPSHHCPPQFDILNCYFIGNSNCNSRRTIKVETQ